MKIAILIPTLNAGGDWVKLLESVNMQSLIFHKKIIVDSGSKDKTTALAKLYGFDVVSIAKKEFNHGRVREQLAGLADAADILVFLTQDAILTHSESIEKLVKVFDDPQIGMAYGRQLPHVNARTLEAHARLFNYPATSQIRSLHDRDKLGFKTIFCSNSFAAYRKDTLKAVGGFPADSIMGEDTIVAAKLLTAGFKVAYVADAMVYHSHTYTIMEEFRRYFDTGVFHTQHKWLLEEYGKPGGEGFRFIRSELKYASNNDLKSLPKSVLSTGAKWLGYKAGKNFKKLPRSMVRKFSMHRFYWD